MKSNIRNNEVEDQNAFQERLKKKPNVRRDEQKIKLQSKTGQNNKINCS